MKKECVFIIAACLASRHQRSKEAAFECGQDLIFRVFEVVEQSVKGRSVLSSATLIFGIN